MVSDRGALFIGCLFAVALSAFAFSRVDALKDHVAREQQQTRDHIAENQRITQSEIDHYKEQYDKMERQFRMTELKLDDWTVVAHRAGLQLPGDYTRGPQGALDAESFHINQEKDHGSRRSNPPAGGKAR